MSPAVGRPWFGPVIDEGGGKVALQAFECAMRWSASGCAALAAEGHPVGHWFRLALAFELVAGAAVGFGLDD